MEDSSLVVSAVRSSANILWSGVVVGDAARLKREVMVLGRGIAWQTEQQQYSVDVGDLSWRSEQRHYSLQCSCLPSVVELVAQQSQ
jgi:hypothetical protein